MDQVNVQRWASSLRQFHYNTSQSADHYQSTSTNASNSKRFSSRQQHFTPSSSEFNATLASPLPITCTDPPPLRTPPHTNDVNANSQNGVRNNPSTSMKIKDNGSFNVAHFNDKYSLSLDLTPSLVKNGQDSNRSLKSQFYPYTMTSDDEEDLHSPFELDAPLFDNQPSAKYQNDFLIDRMLKDNNNNNNDENNSDLAQQQRSIGQSSYPILVNQPSPILTPSSDHRDTDALSDAGTYVIEDEGDVARDDEPEHDIEPISDSNEQETSTSSPRLSPFKRYATHKKIRHGTFDINGLITAPTQSVNRPIVDLIVPTRDLSSSNSNSSSSSSSLLSLPTESNNILRKESEGASNQIIDDTTSTGLVYARQRPTSFFKQQQQQSPPPPPPQQQVKPAECFVISPTFETKPFPGASTNAAVAAPRRRTEVPWKTKSAAKELASSSATPVKDTPIEPPSPTTKKNPSVSSSSPPLSARSNQSDTEKVYFRLQTRNYSESKPPPQQQQQSSKTFLQNSDYTPPTTLASSKTSLRMHTTTDPNVSSSSMPFQRNSSIRQTMPAGQRRPISSSKYLDNQSSMTNSLHIDDNDDSASSSQSSHPSLTKVYMNKSFALRRQRSNLTSTTISKPISTSMISSQQPTVSSNSKPQSQRTQLKSTISTSSTIGTGSSSGQTNRAVELRRARAQAKIEELAQRTRQQLHKTEQQTNDLMTSSWHSNVSSSKKDGFHLRPTHRQSITTSTITQRRDIPNARTVVVPHHRSSSASPNPVGETITKPKYRRSMVTSVTDDQRMNGSGYNEGERCDSLRDNGQRLAIKLIQLSSGILAKLKPSDSVLDDDTSVHELEQLVDKLQTVNRTLSHIDSSLTGPTSDETNL